MAIVDAASVPSSRVLLVVVSVIVLSAARSALLVRRLDIEIVVSRKPTESYVAISRVKGNQGFAPKRLK